MPKISFSSENKVQRNDKFPTLKLGHGERALIAAIETEPTEEFVHTLRAPAIGPDGRVIMEEKENSKGETYTTPKMEWFGSHLCFGDYSILKDKGVDPDNCPSCKAAVEGNGIDAPNPRYAMHVMRYGLKPDSFEVRSPFSIECIAWVFPPSRFNRLIELAGDWNLQEHDLKLGPCENKDYQKYDIQVSSKAEWRLDKSRQEQTAEAYKLNQAPDLSALIGRKIDKHKAQEDLDRVADRLDQAYNKGKYNNSTASATAATALSSDVFDALTTTAPAAEPTTVSEPTPSDPPFAGGTVVTDKPVEATSLEELMKSL